MAGTIAAASVAWLWSRYGHRVNLALFFQVTAVFLLVFVVQLLIYGFHELTEANIFPNSQPWHDATEPFGPDGVYGRAPDLHARPAAARMAGDLEPCESPADGRLRAPGGERCFRLKAEATIHHPDRMPPWP